MIPLTPHGTSSTASALCQTFDRLALKVWTRLDDAARFRMPYGEESITDEILLDLAMSHPQEVAIKKFSKREEGARTGADWEWWFGDRGAWFGMRVQAKALHVGVRRYLSLGHRVRKSKRLQVDLLLQDARKRKLFPVYCLYNFWDITTTRVPWRCPRAPQPHQWGCSLVDGRAVKTLIGSHHDDLATVMGAAFPWTCLPCCPHDSLDGEMGLAGRARALALMLEPQVDNRGRRTATVPPLATEPPRYVRQLLDRQGPFRDPWFDDGANAVGQPNDGWPIESVDGVLVIRDLETHTSTERPPKQRRRKGK
jgi:hypothetical protein